MLNCENWNVICVSVFIIVYNHLHIVIIVFFYILNSGSPFIGAAMFLQKPREDKQQYTLLTDELYRFFTLFFFF